MSSSYFLAKSSGRQGGLLKACKTSLSRCSGHCRVPRREFGMRDVKAWIRKQESINYGREMEAQTAAKQLRAERESPLFVSNQWRPNEQLDASIPVKIPNIGVLHSTDEIRQIVECIDADSENDIETQHPFLLYSLLVIEREPIVRRMDAEEEEYQSALREAKLSQQMPALFRTLFVDKIKKADSERKKNMQIRPRVTGHDTADERHSLNRCLDRRLYLVTKMHNRDSWEFPWELRHFDETLMETAHRALLDRVGPYLKYSTLTSEPFGHIEKLFPSEESEEFGKKGAQVFFHRGYYVSGNGRPVNEDVVEDFAWLPKEQLADIINPDLFESIAPLLLD